MLPEPAVLRWLFASWLWLLREHRREQARSLVLPIRENFPGIVGDPHGVASQWFDRVKHHAGTLEWEDLVLVPDEGEVEGREAMVVPYSAWALGEPAALIAQMATGIGFHLVQRRDPGAPPDPETLDMLAELGAVYLGFGIFLANVASRVYRGPGDAILDWRIFPRGALGERELAYALAIFAWLEEIPDDDVCRFLDPNPAGFYRAATRDLQRRGKELDSLRAVWDEIHDGPYR